jgi:hypothetical protein
VQDWVPASAGTNGGESYPDYQPFVPAEAGTQGHSFGALIRLKTKGPQVSRGPSVIADDLWSVGYFAPLVPAASTNLLV